jgi:hypothetical protein
MNPLSLLGFEPDSPAHSLVTILTTLSRLLIDGRIILNCIFRKQDGKAWTGFIWLRMGTGGGLLKVQH